MKNFLASVFEVVEVALIAVLTVFLIRNFLLQPFLVNGASMEPNFADGDYLLIDELTYRFRSPERGEVIVFRYPGDESVYYIKRIIGLPGERIVLNGGEIKIFNKNNPKGFVLEEFYLDAERFAYGEREFTLGPSEYFVMGDNRPYSFDSRSWGPLAEKELIGLVRLRLWPITKIMAFEKPAY